MDSKFIFSIELNRLFSEFLVSIFFQTFLLWLLAFFTLFIRVRKCWISVTSCYIKEFISNLANFYCGFTVSLSLYYVVLNLGVTYTTKIKTKGSWRPPQRPPQMIRCQKINSRPKQDLIFNFWQNQEFKLGMLPKSTCIENRLTVVLGILSTACVQNTINPWKIPLGKSTQTLGSYPCPCLFGWFLS